MDQNKFLKFGIIALVILAAGWAIYFLIRPEPNTGTNIDSEDFYLVSVSEQDGNILAQAQVGETRLDLNPDNIQQFALLSFSVTKERLWAMCPEGRILKNGVSSSNNSVVIEEGIGVSMNIIPNQQNNLSFICSKP